MDLAYAYGYDHASNLSAIIPNGAQQNYTFTSTNAITAATYDANGSPTVVAGKTYKWDGTNRFVVAITRYLMRHWQRA